MISAQIIKDGAKEYPEIIDYHPEKKVSKTDSYIGKLIEMHFLIPILRDSIYLDVLFRLSSTISISKVGVIKTLSFKWTLRLAWASLLVRI